MSEVDLTTVEPGRSIRSFTPQRGYFVRSLRIDNPSGCWYRLRNNGRIIPPFTLAQQILLIPASQSIDLDFLPSYAGQSSKLVGNDISMLTTDEPVPDSLGISIVNQTPYANTFFYYKENLALATGITWLWTLFPTQASVRIRIRRFEFKCRIKPTATQNMTFYMTTITTDGSGVASTARKTRQDDDPDAQASVVTARDDIVNPGVQPVSRKVIDFFSLHSVPINPQPANVRAYDISGPAMPPSAFDKNIPLGIGLQFNLGPDVTGGVDRYDWTLVWTEEIVS